MADRFEAKRNDPNAGDIQKLLYLIAEFVLRIAAGVMSGAATGYVSHLVLDAVTPRSVPLLCK